MKKLLKRLNSLSNTNKLTAVAVAITIGLIGYIVFAISALEAGPKLYLQPGSSTFETSETITLEVRLDTDGQEVNAVQADLVYPEKNMRFVKAETYDSAFSVEASISGGDGSVNIALGSTSNVSGDVLVAEVVFEILGIQGNKKNNKLEVSFADSSMVIRTSDFQDILQVKQSGQYDINNVKHSQGKGPKR